MKKLILLLLFLLIASTAFSATIKLRRDTAANWTSENPTLSSGELGVETDTRKIKIGTGSSAWTALNYMEASASITGATASDINTGTSTSVYNTPDAIAGSHIGEKEAAWTITDSDTEIPAADGKQAFVVPASMVGMNLVDFTCSIHDLNSAASGDTTVVLRRVRGATAVDMTSTGVTVHYNEYTASDETIATANDDLALGDKLYPDVNAITTASQKGLSCTAVFRLP